jgi:hypothetical protein
MSRAARNAAIAVAVEAALLAGNILGPVTGTPPPSPALCPPGQHLAHDVVGLPYCKESAP